MDIGRRLSTLQKLAGDGENHLGQAILEAGYNTERCSRMNVNKKCQVCYGWGYYIDDIVQINGCDFEIKRECWLCSDDEGECQ